MRFAADENLNGKVLNGLLERLPDLDIVRVQDTEMYEAPDIAVLEWAAREGRILLTHDEQTLIDEAYLRVRQNLTMPGVILVHENCLIGQAIDELEYMIGVGRTDDFDSQVRYIPM
jgi:predicted nuclease of predicted toxin-antitoxin system